MADGVQRVVREVVGVEVGQQRVGLRGLVHEHQRLAQQRAAERGGEQEELGGVLGGEVAGQRVHQRQPHREQQEGHRGDEHERHDDAGVGERLGRVLRGRLRVMPTKRPTTVAGD